VPPRRSSYASRLALSFSTSNGGNVKPRNYFTQLNQSLGASMIEDPNCLSTSVKVDNSAVEADISVILGLMPNSSSMR
jgi:hypothetical protein